MRGSMHNKDIREFNIDSQGMHVGKPFRNVNGILTGNPQYLPPGELGRLRDLFSED
jgi:circadian clock protein KaiC